jgi:hypothetical protein
MVCDETAVIPENQVLPSSCPRRGLVINRGSLPKMEFTGHWREAKKFEVLEVCGSLSFDFPENQNRLPLRGLPGKRRSIWVTSLEDGHGTFFPNLF